ncbi:hypothetical protein [Nocardia sp. NPDC004750]
MMKPKVVGYLRRDISGQRTRRHEMEIRAMAKSSGFDLARTLVAGPTAPLRSRRCSPWSAASARSR